MDEWVPLKNLDLDTVILPEPVDPNDKCVVGTEIS